jgi:hypothetical protein
MEGEDHVQPERPLDPFQARGQDELQGRDGVADQG